MQVARADVISLFDLSFSDLQPEMVDLLRGKHANSALAELYVESFDWLFYRSRAADESALSSVIDDASLPGFRRFCLAPADASGRGSSILLSTSTGIAVYSVWHSFGSGGDARALKQLAWDAYERSIGQLVELGLAPAEVERHYPFVSIRVDTDDLDQYCAANAAAIGELFTGNLEHERSSRLCDHWKANLSWRDYEALLIRWTEALGVYRARIDGQPNNDLYERTLFRALQLFEACILLRRWLRRIANDAESISARVGWYAPRPWAVNRLLSSFATLERDLVVAPPIQSVEADVLLRKAFAAFGIPAMVESARRSCEVLASRHQWAKTQFLVAVAVVSYLLDKLKLFEAIAQYLPWSGKHLGPP